VSDNSQRVDRLRSTLRGEALDALLVTDPANVTYLSGFRGDSSYLIVAQDHLWLITDSRYTEQAEAQAPQCELVARTDGIIQETAKLVEQARLKTVGFEEQRVTCATHRDLCEALDGLDPRPVRDAVETLRSVKSEDEIDTIRAAVQAADAAFHDTVENIQPGQTEREVASRLEFAMQQHGARKPSFDTIVAVRARASLPHAEVTDTVIGAGDPVLIDWGAVRDKYCSDATRVVFLSPPDGQWRKIYRIVRHAQQRALDAIRAGRPIAEVDAAAREHIAEAGYGDNFGHGLGHGVGLRVHEAPRLHAKSEEKLEAGMVVTVEPGIYIPDWGGVRIEDLVVVRDEGAEILTGVAKDLDAMVLS
jgi:Xaa-Pro aminopeptidase